MLAGPGAQEIEHLTIEIRTDPQTLVKLLATATAALYVDGAEVGFTRLRTLDRLLPASLSIGCILIWRVCYPIRSGQEITSDVRADELAAGHITITTGVQIRGRRKAESGK